MMDRLGVFSHGRDGRKQTRRTPHDVSTMLAGQAAWLSERLRRHRDNADVVRQELASELGIVVSLRTVERSISHLRRELAAEALATVRFETPPGRQLQIDFGQSRIAIEGGNPGKGRCQVDGREPGMVLPTKRRQCGSHLARPGRLRHVHRDVDGWSGDGGGAGGGCGCGHEWTGSIGHVALT